MGNIFCVAEIYKLAYTLLVNECVEMLICKFVGNFMTKSVSPLTAFSISYSNSNIRKTLIRYSFKKKLFFFLINNNFHLNLCNRVTSMNIKFIKNYLSVALSAHLAFKSK